MALAWSKAEASDIVIRGMINLYQYLTSILFDPQSTFWYLFIYFASHLGMCFELLLVLLHVSTLIKDSIVVDRVYKSFIILFWEGYPWKIVITWYAIRWDYSEYGLFAPYHAVLDFYAKTTTLAIPSLPPVIWQKSFSCALVGIISYVHACWLISISCLSYLDYVQDGLAENPSITSILVVCE